MNEIKIFNSITYSNKLNLLTCYYTGKLFSSRFRLGSLLVPNIELSLISDPGLHCIKPGHA